MNLRVVAEIEHWSVLTYFSLPMESLYHGKDRECLSGACWIVEDQGPGHGLSGSQLHAIRLFVQQDKRLFQLIVEATKRQQQEYVEEIRPDVLIHAVIRFNKLEEPVDKHITVGELFREQIICLVCQIFIAPLLATLWFPLEPWMALTTRVLSTFDVPGFSSSGADTEAEMNASSKES